MSEKPLDLDVFKEILEEIYKRRLGAGISQKAYDSYYEVIKITINKIKQQIREACMFYLKYKNDPESLIEEHPDYAKKKIAILNVFDEPTKLVSLEKFIAVIKKLNSEEYSRQIENSYNEWLFKQTFKVIFKEVKENGKNNK